MAETSYRLPLERSKIETWTSGGKAEFSDCWPTTGPRGGRRVLRGVWVYGSLSANVTVGSLPALDKARIFKNIIVKQRGGRVRWNLTGMESRFMVQLLMGPERVSIGSAVGTGSPTTIAYSLYIPFRKPNALRKKDMALPVEALDTFTIEFPTDADLTIGGATVGILSGSYYLVADAHEDKPGEVIDYAQDEVAAVNFQSATEGEIKTRGRIHDLFFCRPATTAGGAVSFTEFRSEALGIAPVTPTELLERYRLDRPVSVLNPTNDPFEAGKAVAIICSHEELSLTHGKVTGTTLLRLAGNASTDIRTVYRVVVGKDAGLTAYLESQHRLSGAYDVKALTPGGKGLGGWGDVDALVLPTKAK